MPIPKKPYVFVCYSHHDRQDASNFSTRLDEAGIDHFFDKNDIPWGGSIPESVHSALEDTTDLVVLISKDSVESPWVAYEVGFARGKKANLQPYLIDQSTSLPGFLGDIRYLKDLDEELDWRKKLLSRERKETHTQRPRTAEGKHNQRTKELREAERKHNQRTKELREAERKHNQRTKELREAEPKMRSRLPERRREGVRTLIELEDTTYAMKLLDHRQAHVRAAAAEVLAVLQSKDGIKFLVSGLLFEGTRNRSQIIPKVEKLFTHYGRSALPELISKLHTKGNESEVWVEAMANAASDDLDAVRMLLEAGTRSGESEFLAAALQTKFELAEDQLMETIESYLDKSKDGNKRWKQRRVAKLLAGSRTGSTEWARRVVKTWTQLLVASCPPDERFVGIERDVAAAALKMKAVSRDEVKELSLLTKNKILIGELQTEMSKALNDRD